MNRGLKVILCGVTVALLCVLVVTLLSVFLTGQKQSGGRSSSAGGESSASGQSEGRLQENATEQEGMHGRELGIRVSAEDVIAWLLGQHFTGEDGACSPHWESSSDPRRRRCLLPLVCHTWHAEEEEGRTGFLSAPRIRERRRVLEGCLSVGLHLTVCSVAAGSASVMAVGTAWSRVDKDT